MADLTKHFKIAYQEGKRAESKDRLLRVVLIYCHSSTKTQLHWSVNLGNFTLETIYLHDKPGADNCPQKVYDALVEAGTFLRLVNGNVHSFIPLQRCIQDDLDIPKDVAKKTLAVEAAQDKDGTPVSSQQ